MRKNSEQGSNLEKKNHIYCVCSIWIGIYFIDVDYELL